MIVWTWAVRSCEAAIQYRKGTGTDTTHWRVGTPGMKHSTRCAAVWALRRAAHDGQKPRRLQLEGSNSSFGHVSQPRRRKPWARIPHRRCCTCSLRVIPGVQKTRYNAPFTTSARGLCHGIPSRFLPARADRPGVGVPETLWAVAIGACCSAPNAPQATDAPVQALQKTHAFSGSHPDTLLHCL